MPKLKDVSWMDEGFYTCMAGNTIGETVSQVKLLWAKQVLIALALKQSSKLHIKKTGLKEFNIANCRPTFTSPQHRGAFLLVFSLHSPSYLPPCCNLSTTDAVAAVNTCSLASHVRRCDGDPRYEPVSLSD